MSRSRPWLLLGLAIVLASCAPASPGATADASEPPPSATASAIPSPSPSEPAEAAEPLLQALAYLPFGAFTLDFTDWVALKAALGMPDLTSASTDDDRSLFASAVTAVDATDTPFAMLAQDTFRPGGLRTHWGFDNTDLTWEATVSGPFGLFAILRFPDGFDFGPMTALFDERGFSTETVEGVTVRSHDIAPDDWVLQGTLSFLNVALLPDGHTLMAAPHREALEAALAPDSRLLSLPGSQVVLDAATALEQPTAAWLSFELTSLCDPRGRTRPGVLSAVEQLLTEAGPLHAYTVLAIGNRGSLSPPGRLVFGYTDAADAAADLAGRMLLAADGITLDTGAPIGERIFTLVDGTTAGGNLILAVGPPVPAELPPSGITLGLVRYLYVSTIRRELLFAACEF